MRREIWAPSMAFNGDILVQNTRRCILTILVRALTSWKMSYTQSKPTPVADVSSCQLGTPLICRKWLYLPVIPWFNFMSVMVNSRLNCTKDLVIWYDIRLTKFKTTMYIHYYISSHFRALVYHLTLLVMHCWRTWLPTFVILRYFFARFSHNVLHINCTSKLNAFYYFSLVILYTLLVMPTFTQTIWKHLKNRYHQLFVMSLDG